MMAGSRLRVWRSLRLERLLAAAGAAAAGEEQEKTLLSRLCADIAAGAAPGTAGRPGVLPGLSLPLPPAPARAARSGPRGVPLGRAQPPAVRPDGGTAGLMAASDPGAAPRLPPARSLCWEGEGGGKKKKSYERKGEGKRQQRSFYLGSPQAARVTPPSAAMRRESRAAPHTHSRSGPAVAGPVRLPSRGRKSRSRCRPHLAVPRDAPVGGAGEAAPPDCAGTGAAGPGHCRPGTMQLRFGD